MCVCAQDPERRMEEKGLRRDHPPLGADFSLSVSLSFWRAHAPYSENLSKKKKKEELLVCISDCIIFKVVLKNASLSQII